MVLLEVLLLSYAVLSDLFRVLVGDVSCAWPAPDFLCFLHYRVFWDRFFLATLAHLQEAFSFISFAVVFYFLGIIKVGYGVAHRSYPVFSMTCCLWSFLFSLKLLESAELTLLMVTELYRSWCYEMFKIALL